jgi:hypothetical protein
MRGKERGKRREEKGREGKRRYLESSNHNTR